MRQIHIKAPNEVVIKSVDIPKAGEDEILLRVNAIGLNQADLLQSEGLYQMPNGLNVPGLEISGTDPQTNQSYCALLNGGGFSEYVLVNKKNLMPIPNNLNVIDAASIPEALITCWLNLFALGDIKNAESLLIHGGSSGIGTYAIQIAKAFNKTVFSSVGLDAKLNKCKALGADYVFNYNDNYVTLIKDYNGVDVVLDILGGESFAKNLRCLKQNGRLILLAVMTGTTSTINLSSILLKNLKIIGSTLRSKSIEEKASLIKSVIKELYPLIENGKIKPQIDSIFKFDDFKEAFNRMKSRNHFGKILITI